MKLLASLLIVATLLVSLVIAQTDPHKIISLPGYSAHIPFNQYAGYILADKTNGRNLFYWFVESQGNPSNDPVVLWMNGGPGCSSLDGFMVEHSPFRIQKDGKTLASNPYSWNKVANVIYLESPAGVGFSYSENPQVDYRILNDEKTANDVYNFLVGFFNRYPQFRNNEFYVSGESYAGHYVPVSTLRILMGNLERQNPQINLKGFIVGNGVTDASSDTNSIPEYMYNHALISQAQFRRGYDLCKGDFYKNQNLPQCADQLDIMFNTIVGVNPYWLAGPCEGSPGPFVTRATRNNKKSDHPLFQMWRMSGPSGSNSGSAPCIDPTPETTYFNTPEVKAAIHARQDIQWEFCNDDINAAYNRTYETMIPIYSKLLSSGLRALVYSGDLDLAVNTLGSEMAIGKLVDFMRAKEIDTWRTWNYESETDGTQVGGMTQSFSNSLQFTTIRGAGHMVPQMKPVPALVFFSKWLKRQKL